MRFVSAVALLLALCGLTPAATQEAANRFQQITEYWQWTNYWLGRTDLGVAYPEGKEVRILLFWNRGPGRPHVGFCSLDLSLCRAYADPSEVIGSSGIAHLDHPDLMSAFLAFADRRFNLDPALRTSAMPGLYETEEIVARFPKLDLPEAIRNRRRPPGWQEAGPELLALLKCPGNNCGTHLLVPYFGESDPVVLVYRECAEGCANAGRAILAVRRDQGVWHVTAQEERPSELTRVLKLIRSSLMLDLER